MTEKQKIISAMTAIGTYKEEYADAIVRLADMRTQYKRLTKQAAQMDPALLEDFHKPAIISTIESLRRDILAYERDLGLTPAALKRIDAQNNMPQSSVLSDALRALGGA